MGFIKLCHSLYQNFWYLVKKNIPEKYYLVDVLVEFNRVTIKNANLPLSTDKFLEKFADYAILSFIYFFFGYDQVELDKKSQDLIGFMTPLGFIRITTSPQRAINLVAQFVKIVFKVLSDYLRD